MSLKKMGLALVTALALAGCGGGEGSSSSITENVTPETAVASAAEEVTYQGQDGKTALELLQAEHEVEMQGEGEMAFVTAIDGIKADPEGQFWAFYVNGQPAQVGAGAYPTSDDETISWRLETF